MGRRSSTTAVVRPGRRLIAAYVLETATPLRLQELNGPDIDFVAHILAAPVEMRHCSATLTRDESVQGIERQRGRYSRDGHGPWLVEQREDAVPVGQIGLLNQEVAGGVETEIGYLLDAPIHRIGYATAAVLALRSHAFEVQERRRVVSLIRPRNLPSQPVERRLGMSVDRDVEYHGLRHHLFAVERDEPPVPAPG